MSRCGCSARWTGGGRSSRTPRSTPAGWSPAGSARRTAPRGPRPPSRRWCASTALPSSSETAVAGGSWTSTHHRQQDPLDERPLPQCHLAASSRTEVFLRYLAYFRDGVGRRVEAMSEEEARRSRVPSGWTPLELVRHLTFMERRWFLWGFEGERVPDPS